MDEVELVERFAERLSEALGKHQESRDVRDLAQLLMDDVRARMLAVTGDDAAFWML